MKNINPPQPPTHDENGKELPSQWDEENYFNELDKLVDSNLRSTATKADFNIIIPTMDDYNRPTCTLMIGASGSGKSLWVKNHIENMEQKPIIFNEMKLKSNRYKFINQYMPDYFKNLRHFVDLKNSTAFIKSLLHVSCATGRDVIIDRTNMGSAERAEFIRIAKSWGYTLIAHEMKVPAYLAILRVRRRKSHPTLQRENAVVAVKSQINRYEKPTLTEFDEIIVSNKSL